MNFQKLIKNATITEEEINIYEFQNKETGQDEYLTLTYDTYHGKFLFTSWYELTQDQLDEIERLILENHAKNGALACYTEDDAIDDLVSSYRDTF